MELVPRPNEYPEEAWAMENTDKVYVNPLQTFGLLN